jgi:hypothetical protein
MIDSDDMIVEGDAFGNLKAGAPGSLCSIASIHSF